MYGKNQLSAFKAPGHLFEWKVPHGYYNCQNIYLKERFLSAYTTQNSGTVGDDLILAVGAMTSGFFDDYKFGLCFTHELLYFFYI